MEENKIEELESQQPVMQAPVAPAPAPVNPTPVYQAPQVPSIPEEYKPISMWGYFGYQLLFAIPCVGFIILLVFAFGGNKNINVKNFAKSYFCWFIIGLVLGLIAFLLTTIMGVAIFNSASSY